MPCLVWMMRRTAIAATTRAVTVLTIRIITCPRLRRLCVHRRRRWRGYRTWPSRGSAGSRRSAMPRFLRSKVLCISDCRGDQNPEDCEHVDRQLGGFQRVLGLGTDVVGAGSSVVLCGHA